MKLSISNIAWNDSHEYYYQLMLQNGFSGLEIAPTKFSSDPYDNLELAKQVRQELLSKYNFPVVSMQSLLFGTDGLAIFTSQEARNNMKCYLKKAIVYAETIGCPVLVFGNPKNRIMQNPDTDYSIAIEFFKELGQFAKIHNTCLCIEPNPNAYGTNFINTLTEATQLVDDVQSDGFGMIIDCSTMLINQDKPEDALAVLHNTRHIHMSMPFLKPLNQEFTQYKVWIERFLSIIKNSDYDKYISIEMVNATQLDIGNSLTLLKNLAE